MYFVTNASFSSPLCSRWCAPPNVRRFRGIVYLKERPGNLCVIREHSQRDVATWRKNSARRAIFRLRPRQMSLAQASLWLAWNVLEW